MPVKTMIGLKKAADVAKPFVGSLKFKGFNRPVLKTAFVGDQFVMATNSHIAICIKHGETTMPYLHHYIPETRTESVNSYPNVYRIFPHPMDAKLEFEMDVEEYLEAHQIVLFAAKQHKNNICRLQDELLSVKPLLEQTAGGKIKRTPAFEQVDVKHELKSHPNVNVTYNCEYMIMAMKAFKKLKIKKITCFYYGPLKPMLFKDEDSQADVLILPIKIH